ncbi:MAG: hypothetical protein M0R16_10950, partial [Bacteroidales bacterium]|nr:hypothetical protein [Bacteroidales bacterium]
MGKIYTLLSKKLKNHLIIYTLFFVFLIFSNLSSGYSQCTNCTYNAPAGTLSGTAIQWTQSGSGLYSGSYSYWSLDANYFYQWYNYGYDTYLVLYPQNNCDTYFLAYDDNNGAGNESMITYTPGSTAVRLLSTYYTCASGTSYSGTLNYRAIPKTPSISASITQVCSGGAVILYANSANIQDDDYMNCRWGTTSGGTEAGYNTNTITVNPTVNTTYYLQYEVLSGAYPGSTLYSNVASITIYVDTQAPTITCPTNKTVACGA